MLLLLNALENAIRHREGQLCAKAVQVSTDRALDERSACVVREYEREDHRVICRISGRLRRSGQTTGLGETSASVSCSVTGMSARRFQIGRTFTTSRVDGRGDPSPGVRLRLQRELRISNELRIRSCIRKYPAIPASKSSANWSWWPGTSQAVRHVQPIELVLTF